MQLVRSIAGCALLWIGSGEAAAFAGSASGWELGTAGVPPMRIFTARDTGVATMAWSAAQDRTGMLYFGCDTVVSFDGDRWRPQKMESTYLVRGLDVGPDGRIWAAGENQIGWFAPDAQGRLRYHSLMNRLPPGKRELGDVWRVYAQGSDGAIFVARERILRWDGRKMESWDYPGMHLLWSTRTPRSVYVHYPPLGLLRMDKAGPSLVAPAAVIGQADVRWLDDSAPDWLLLTSQGFKSLHGNQCIPLNTEASDFARAYTPTCAAKLGDGTLAIGSLQGGIGIADQSGGLRRVFNIRSGLPANPIYSLFLDRDGALWAMGPAHIVRLSLRSGTALYGRQGGYPAGGCDALAEDSGALFVASHGDILRLSPDPQSGGAGQLLTLGLSSSRFYCLLSVPQGLAVGEVHGLGLYSGREIAPLLRVEDAVFHISSSEYRHGRVLASTLSDIRELDPTTGRSSIVADSLPDYGDTMIDEPSGRIWIGTPSHGLFVADPAGTKSFPAGPRFGPLPPSGPAMVARAGTVVVALMDGAAYYLDKETDRFRRIPGFPVGKPLAVSNPDSKGDVWAALEAEMGGHSPRLGKITIADGELKWSPQSVEGLSGIGSLMGLLVARISGREDLWISGTESLVRAAPEALAPRPAPRSPMIRAEVIGSGDRFVAGALPYSTRGLHIEYGSLDFGMRESERFQTMLGGADIQWSPPTDSADRDVSGLREGSYDFKVRLVTDSGETGDAAVLHFDIAPPWWRTPLARVCFLATGVLGIVVLLRLRTRSLKRRAYVLERMVRQRTEELQKANAAKTEFVASMSHEIRNPMGGILASALELSEGPLGPEQQRLVMTIRSCANFLASLVEDVLDFAAIEAGAYKVTLSPFSPREILENVVTMLEPRAAGARMDMSVDPTVPERIMGDAARIQQVIVNFAANSIKFGGRKISLSARADGGHVVFAVSDDGIGIPEEEKKNLFIRFSRLKSARNSAIPGTGLGLAVSRVLAERMGGSVGFVTEHGLGSTFHLRLPMAAGLGPEVESPDFDACGSRALVVEDIGYNARALGLMLGRIGFEVDYAADGEEALARLSSAHYDSVFLDCDIPRINGVEVARRHRAAEGTGGRTLIIATTALSTAKDRDECMAAGMDGFITKPITPEKLRAALSDRAGFGRERPPGARDGEPGPVDTGPRLDLIRHLADGSPESLGRELAAFTASLREAVAGLVEARASGERPVVSSASHRILSLARMVDARLLASTAADIQDFASAYTQAELDDEISVLVRQADELRSELERLGTGAPVNPSLAS